MRTDRLRACARAGALATALAALAVTSSSPARADTPPSPEHEAAFRSGLSHFEKADYVAAITTWESLLATIGEERGYKVLYNLGLAYEAIGDVTHAIERFHAFERQVAQRPDAPAELAARADDARTRAAQLEATHGAVYVDTPKRGGVVLTRFGAGDPRAAGYVMWLAPGRHTIEIFVGTERARAVAVDVEPGKSVHIDTTPPEEPSPLTQQTAPTRAAEPPSSTWLWIGAGAAVASLALPVTLFFVAKGKRDDADALGPGRSSYADIRSSYQTWRSVYYASYAVPATFAVLTGVAFLLRPSATTAVAISPAGASLDGRF